MRRGIDLATGTEEMLSAFHPWRTKKVIGFPILGAAFGEFFASELIDGALGAGSSGAVG